MKNSINESPLYLFCILLGGTPKGRNTEQHDVMFAVANRIEDLYDEMKIFWHRPVIADIATELKKLLPGIDTGKLSDSLLKTLSQRDKVHIDAWMKVEYAGNYKVLIEPLNTCAAQGDGKLYFVNLGGYKEGEFEEFHKKLFVVANGVTDAMAQLRSHNFMNEYTPTALGTKAKAHFDDKHEINFEADDVICVADIVTNYTLVLEPTHTPGINETVIGYVPLQYK